MKNLLTSRLWIIGLWIGLHSTAWSSPKTIWSIGQENGSNEELALFAQFMDYAKEFPREVQYAIGIAQPESAWPGVQPGPVDDWAGSKLHPYEVQFTLPKVEAINANKWLDELSIDNGHIYAYIMNNYWFTNYKAAQGGSLDFRFALTSDKSIPLSTAARFGRSWSPAGGETT